MPSESAPASYQKMLVVICAVALGCYFGTYMRLPVVPLYARSLGADAVQVGLINAAFLLSAGVLSLPLGAASARLGMKLLAGCGLVILSASSFLLYLSDTPAQFIWIYLFSGVGLAAFGPTMMSLTAMHSPPTHLGRSYGWYTTAIYTGMSLGPAVGGFTAQAWGFPTVFFISGLAILTIFWLMAAFLPGDRPVEGFTAAGSRQGPGASRDLLRNRPLWGCWLATLGGCFGLGMFVTYLPLHSHDQGLSYSQIGLVFAVQGLVNAVSRFPFGHLSDRLSSRTPLVVVGLVGLAFSLAGFGYARQPFHFFLCAIILGASMGLAFTSIGALTAETVPPASRGWAMGGYNSAIYLGMMLSSAVMGPVIHRTGFPEGFLLTLAINLLVTGAFYLLMRGFFPTGPIKT